MGNAGPEREIQMTHVHMWVGAVVAVGLLAVGLLGGLGWFGSLDRTAGVAGADSAVEKVRCDTGQTLTEALKKAKPGDTLQVTGTCHERVTITTDRLTLDGDSSAVLDGSGGSPTSSFEAGVTIDGVQGVQTSPKHPLHQRGNKSTVSRTGVPSCIAPQRGAKFSRQPIVYMGLIS